MGPSENMRRELFPECGDDPITMETGFLAMELFLKKFWGRDGQSDDAFVRLLSFIDMSEAGYRPADPAMWGDWLACVDEVKARYP